MILCCGVTGCFLLVSDRPTIHFKITLGRPLIMSLNSSTVVNGPVELTAPYVIPLNPFTYNNMNQCHLFNVNFLTLISQHPNTREISPPPR